VFTLRGSRRYVPAVSAAYYVFYVPAVSTAYYVFCVTPSGIWLGRFAHFEDSVPYSLTLRGSRIVVLLLPYSHVVAIVFCVFALRGPFVRLCEP